MPILGQYLINSITPHHLKDLVTYVPGLCF